MKVSAINLCFKGYKKHDINNANFTVETGQCLVISGLSGCGKSLLLSLICGLVEASSGEVLFDGIRMRQMTIEQDAQFRKRLGVVFETPALLSNLTIKENLLLPLTQHYPMLSGSEREQLVVKSCEQFKLQGFLDDRVEELSSGMQALASLARALICDPELLIWDAPLSNIDLTWSTQIIEKLKSMKAEHKTMILFTNRESLIAELADRHLQLVSGELQNSSR
ncbi:MAG: ABC-type multidrug transport system ATPase subunit [Gammaproteobacteria bacterium]